MTTAHVTVDGEPGDGRPAACVHCRQGLKRPGLGEGSGLPRVARRRIDGILRMGRRGYPGEFRRKVLDLIEAGRSVTDVARDLGISGQTIYTWRRQDQIDRGLVPVPLEAGDGAQPPHGDSITMWALTLSHWGSTGRQRTHGESAPSSWQWFPTRGSDSRRQSSGRSTEDRCRCSIASTCTEH